jgi:hypothetical protein
MLAGALVLAACGGDDGEDSATAGTTVAGPEGVPNACGLVTREQLMPILGRRPGRATPSAYDPELRRICTYRSGVIVAVEIAEN